MESAIIATLAELSLKLFPSPNPSETVKPGEIYPPIPLQPSPIIALKLALENTINERDNLAIKLETTESRLAEVLEENENLKAQISVYQSYPSWIMSCFQLIKEQNDLLDECQKQINILEAEKADLEKDIQAKNEIIEILMRQHGQHEE